MKEIKELWDNPRYKALIKLLLWVIFFLVIYSLILVSNNRTIKNNEEDSKNEINYTKILNLSYNTLKVRYELNEYYVEGFVQNNIFNGYINYKDGTTYNIKYDGNTITKINDSINDEYLVISIDNQYLLPSYLVNLFKNNKPKQIDTNVYSYKLGDIEYQVKYNDKELYEINIIENGNISKLMYSVVD